MAVAEELNFRAAAERLHLSQPPLSRTILQLEELLGHALFVRSRQGVAPTAAGRALLPGARRLLVAADQLVADLPPEDVGGRGPRRVGVFFAVHPSAQAALLAALGRTGIEVGRSHELTAAVRQGRLFAALVMLPAPTLGLAVQQIGQAEMLAAVPAAHALARKRALAVADLDAFPRLLFLGRRQNPPLYAYLDDALRARGLVAPRYSVPRDTYAGLTQIAAGQACTVLCSWVGDFVQSGVTLRPLLRRDRLPVSIGWVTRRADADAARAVAKAMGRWFAAASSGPRT